MRRYLVRAGLAATVPVLLAGCGGSPDPPDATPGPAPDRRIATGELRSPDARSPFVSAGDGAWRCPSEGQVQLAVSADGEVSLATPGMVLGSLAPTRAVVNRACDRAPRGAGRRDARSGRVGAVILRCRSPRAVLVDFGGGDLSVRAPGGSYLAGAAVRADRIGVAVYWGPSCAPLSGG